MQSEPQQVLATVRSSSTVQHDRSVGCPFVWERQHCFLKSPHKFSSFRLFFPFSCSSSSSSSHLFLLPIPLPLPLISFLHLPHQPPFLSFTLFSASCSPLQITRISIVPFLISPHSLCPPACRFLGPLFHFGSLTAPHDFDYDLVLAPAGCLHPGPQPHPYSPQLCQDHRCIYPCSYISLP